MLLIVSAFVLWVVSLPLFSPCPMSGLVSAEQISYDGLYPCFYVLCLNVIVVIINNNNNNIYI